MSEQLPTPESRFQPHYDDTASFREEAFTPNVVGRGAHLQAMVVCFEAGQFIPVHAPQLDIALVILEGEGELALDSGTVPLAAGAVAFVPAGGTRGIRADTRLKAFQVVSPVPTTADHAGVAAGLKRGAWR